MSADRRKARVVPLPGRRVRGSKSGRPEMAIIDLIGRRSLLRILWELRGDTLRFRTLQAACGALSPTLLNLRLKEMREAMLVELTGEGYSLTVLGKELLEVLLPLATWAKKWSDALALRGR